MAWTESWNSLNTANFLAGYGTLHPKAVETISCYLEDDGPDAEVPFLIIHDLCAEEFKGAYGLRPVDPVAYGVAAQVVCKLTQQQPGILLLARFLHRQITLQNLLEGIRAQVSVALQAKLPPTTTLPALLHTISQLLPTADCQRCVIVLAGAEHISVDEGAPGVTLGRAHVPQFLSPRLKLLLTVTLDERTAELDLPALCLHLRLPALCEADLLRLVVGRGGAQPLADKKRDLAKRSLIPLAAANDLPQALALARQLADSFTLAEAASSEVNGGSSLHDALRLSHYVDFGVERGVIAPTVQRLLQFASEHPLGLHSNELIDLFTGLLSSAAARDGAPPVNWKTKKLALGLGCIYFALYGLVHLRFSSRYSETSTKAVNGNIVHRPASVPVSYSDENTVDREVYALQLAYVDALTQENLEQSAECALVNVRHLLQLHRCTLKLGLFERLCTRHLFSLAWIRRVCIECTLEGVLGLYDAFIALTDSPGSMSRDELAQIQMQASFVRDVLAASTCGHVRRTQSLAVEMLGRLLAVFTPSDTSMRFLNQLISRCSSLCTRKLGLLPRMPFPHAVGDSLLVRFQLPAGSLDSWVLVDRLLLMKMRGSSLLYRLDLDHADKLVETQLAAGSLYVSQKHGIILDDVGRSAIMVYGLGKDSNAPQFTYQYTVNPHKSLNGNTPVDDKRAGVCTVLCLDVMCEFLAIVVSTSTQMKLIRDTVQTTENENDNLSPLTHNIVAVYHLHEGDLIFATCPPKQATFVKIYPNSVDPWNPIIFTNNGDKLAIFTAHSNIQLAQLDLQTRPLRMLFCRQNTTVFLLTEEPRKVIFLRLKEDATVKSSFRVSFQKVIPEDVITDLTLNSSGQLLLIQALKHLVVYEADTDKIVFLANIFEGLQQACMPECYFEKFSISDALLAYDDNLVLAAAYNLVIVWSMESEIILCVLKAEPAPLTRLMLSLGSNGCCNLIGYCETTRRLYIWDLETALKFSDFTDVENANENDGMRLKSPDLMPGPIRAAVQVDPGTIAVICEDSETIYLVDGASCEIVDWIDVQEPVEALLISPASAHVIAQATATKQTPSEARWRLFDLNTKKVLYEADRGERLLMSAQGFIGVGSNASCPVSKCEFKQIRLATDARAGVVINISTEQISCGLPAAHAVAVNLDLVFSTRDGQLLVFPALQHGWMAVVDRKTKTWTFDRSHLEAELARNEIHLQVVELLDCRPSVASCIILLFSSGKSRRDVCAAHLDLKEGQLINFLSNVSVAFTREEEMYSSQLDVASNLCYLYNRESRTMYAAGEDNRLRLLSLPWTADLSAVEFAGFCENSQAAVFYSGSLLLLVDLREGGRKRAHVDCGGEGIVFVSLRAQNLLVGCRNGALFSFALTISATGEPRVLEVRPVRRRSSVLDSLDRKCSQDRRRGSLEELHVES
ncbi:unnamed protein product [Dibothriocephalus latus]|uniref:Uncharacterized protein n=1 Tax=Dibothriocephalus latus TaxID=60516 RepID=A0A3P6NZJ0_DIBLA|nr:unnamed protein product [Dibothriocephalus latus]